MFASCFRFVFSFCFFAFCFRFVFSFCVFVLCFRFLRSVFVLKIRGMARQFHLTENERACEGKWTWGMPSENHFVLPLFRFFNQQVQIKHGENCATQVLLPWLQIAQNLKASQLSPKQMSFGCSNRNWMFEQNDVVPCSWTENLN